MNRPQLTKFNLSVDKNLFLVHFEDDIMYQTVSIDFYINEDDLDEFELSERIHLKELQDKVVRIKITE